MKTYNFITLILILTIIGCASSFSKRTSKRTIKLKKLNPSETKIGFENDKAIVKFEKSDIIELILKDYDKYPTHYKKEELEKIKNLTSDSIINETENKSSVKFWEYEYNFHVLLLKGKAEIESKKSGKVNRIIYERYKTKLGGKDAYFLFENGLEFYKMTLALGE